jgi:dienelactone hydrolase
LEKYWSLLSQQAEYDAKRIVTAGLSKGGEVAVWLAMSGMVPAQGFLAIAPGGPRVAEPQKLLPLVESSRERGIQGYLLVGDQDTYCYEPTMRLSAFLKEQGIPHELEIRPGVGHWFPPDFERSLRRGLEFILGRAA